MGFRRGASSASRAAVLTILIVAAIVPGMQVNAAYAYHDYTTLPLFGEKVIKCSETTAQTLWWTANGEAVSRMNDSTIQQGTVQLLGSGDTVILQLSLTVQATGDNNNTVFRCMAAPDNVLVYCVNMTVQGLLQAPVELTATPLDTSSVKLQWTPPFTLDVTDEHPDITHYSIYITDIDTNEVTQVNVTGTEYTFTDDKCKDVAYEFSISAWNMVGEGETGHFTGQYDFKASEVTEISVSHTEGDAVAACEFYISTTCHGKPLPETCTVEVSSSTGNSKQLLHTLYGESNHMIEIDELSLDTTYELTVTCDGSEITQNFTTYDTQSATTTMTSELGAVDIECIFAQGSNASGCLVVLSDGPGCELELYREKGDSKATGQITLPRGTYHAKAYDIEQNGKKSVEQPAVVMDSFTVKSSSTSVCGTGEKHENESSENETGSGNAATELIILTVVATGVVLVVITALTVVVVVKVYRKRAHRKNHSTDAAFIIPTVEQNSYEATQTKPQTASSDLESSGTSGSTVESHLSSDFTIPLEPPEGTPGLLYASLQVQPPRGQALRKEDDVAYTQVHLPNVHEP